MSAVSAGRRPVVGVVAAVVVSSAGGWLVGRRECGSLRERAQRDPLTGLLNRAGLYAAAGPMLRAAGSRVGALLVDLDGFKPVNDTHGHAVGDWVLVAAAGRLAAVVGGRRGTAARLGGDEFAVLLPGLPAAELAAARVAVEAGWEVAAALGEPYRFPGVGVELRVGASVGTATAAAPGGVAGLLSAADMAMYAVKRAGGAGVGQAPDAAAAAAVGEFVPAPRRPADRLRDAPAGRAVGAGR